MSRGYAGDIIAKRHLQYDERRNAFIVRHSGILLASPIARMVGALMAGLGAGIVAGNNLAVAIVWILSGLVILAQAVSIVNWYFDFFIIAPGKLILSTGLVANQSVTIDLARVWSVKLERSWRGQLLGYGSFIIKTAGQGDYTANYVRNPEALYRDISELVRAAGGLADS